MATILSPIESYNPTFIDVVDWLTDHIDEDIYCEYILDIMDGLNDPLSVIHLIIYEEPPKAFEKLLANIGGVYVPRSIKVKQP